LNFIGSLSRFFVGNAPFNWLLLLGFSFRIKNHALILPACKSVIQIKAKWQLPDFGEKNKAINRTYLLLSLFNVINRWLLHLNRLTESLRKAACLVVLP
jgi:hypothetical protein